MKTEFATFGGGCFWGIEKFLQEIPGVIDAVSGYSGGEFVNPTYSDVCGGFTGHAEVVNVEFDPETITFEVLLMKFLKTYRDTNLENLESNSQYRSIVFFREEIQKKKAEQIFEEFEKQSGKTLSTQLKLLDKFYKAEERHQDYYGVCRITVENV